MYEHRHEPVAPRPKFHRRLLRHVLLACMVAAGSLAMGVLGYHFFEGLGWLDSLLNASMILGGMGPVNELHRDAGKWFASFYALFSGVAFITGMAVVFAPIVHRFLHKLHVESRDR